jgi:asparagine synthase (glutamine-hydrolysing)
MAICGIAVSREGIQVDALAIKSMVSALTMGKGWSTEQSAEPEIGVGATSPTASTGVWNSEQVVAAIDADLYNQEELRARVAGGLPRGADPARLLGQLYLELGWRFLEELRGIFAIALWDRRAKTLLLATDRFGAKPICYSTTSTAIVFASQSRGILASHRVARTVNTKALLNYLNFTVVPAPLSAFEGITKLPPGSFLLWKGEVRQSGQYWEMKYPEDMRVPEDTLARELRVRMEEAVRCTLSDVPDSHLGCFLSGGTDSSSIVGLATRVRKSPVTSISVGFAEKRFDELEFARIAAKQFGSRHIVSCLGPEEAFQILPHIVALYDEPFANSSVIAAYQCQKVARERGIDVMLAGDGGDELFGGNERYRTHQVYDLYHRIPQVLRRGLIEPIVSHLSGDASGLSGKLKRYIQTSNTPNPERYFRWSMLQYFPPEQILGAAIPCRNGDSDLLAIPRAHYHAATTTDELNRLLYIDVKMTLGDNDLPKVMRAAELAGLKVRFPYLDHPLVEFSGRIPANLKVRGFQKRYLFKKATSDLLPKAILEKRKHGFGLPIGIWLKTDRKLRKMSEEVLHDPRTYQRGYFQRDFIDRTFAAMDRDDSPFYGDVLWPFLMLELWYREHVEGTR